MLSAPISGALLNTYGSRPVVIIGSILAAVSFVASTFSPNIYVHYVLYGLLGGSSSPFI